MKKLLIISILLFTCNQTYLADAQKHNRNIKEHLQTPQEGLKKSSDKQDSLLASIKKLATQRIIYRTKVVVIHDTVSRIDTCVRVITLVDSATISILFKNREIANKTKIGRIIYYISHKKSKPNN